MLGWYYGLQFHRLQRKCYGAHHRGCGIRAACELTTLTQISLMDWRASLSSSCAPNLIFVL